MESYPDRDGAESALDLVTSSRAHLADRLVTPWWYHPALGLLVGGFVASYAARSLLVTAVALALYGVGLGALISTYRRLTGLWINGFRAGRASRWAVALGVATVIALLTGVVLDRTLDWRWASVVAGAVLAPVVVLLGRRFDDDLRAQLRGQR